MRHQKRNIMTSAHALLLLCLSVVLPSAYAATASQDMQVASGGYWSRGDYDDDEETIVHAVPLTLRIRTGAWMTRISTTLLSIDGPSNVINGSTLENSRNERQSGWGDTWLSASYQALPRQSGTLFVDITGRIKGATGDETQGLGTGTTDIELRMDTFKRVQGITLITGFGYRWRYGGDPSYDNSANATAGADWQWKAGVNIGASFSIAESATASGTHPREGLLYASAKHTSGIKWTFYVLRGLSDASPDIGAGFTVAHIFRKN